MSKLYNKKYDKKSLLQRVGDIRAIAGVRLMKFSDGPERNVRAAIFRTGSGFNFTVLLDRGMDIGLAEYNGIPLNWISSVGEASPAYYESDGINWLRNFHGGLLNTCGLTYAGAACEDNGVKLGLHGRASNTPAYNVSIFEEWKNNEYIFGITGFIKETRVFGENIVLKRKITCKLGEKKLLMEDTVENKGYSRTEHMLLYHINIGFPVVDEGSYIHTHASSITPRDAEAVKGKEDYSKFTAPVKDFKEKVYFHEMIPDKKGFVHAALINPKFEGKGLGVYIRYKKKEFPKFVEWKQMGEGTYVVGMEPANCLVEGRDKDRKRGILQFLKPGEKRNYHMEIGVINSRKEILTFLPKEKRDTL